MDKYVVVHVKQTGGRTLIDIWKRKFREQHVLVEGNHNPTIGFYKPLRTTRKPNKYIIIQGHFSIARYTHLNRPTITFLRNPLSRFLSNWMRSSRKRKAGHPDPIYRAWLEKDFSIYDWMQIQANCYTLTYFPGKHPEDIDFVGFVEEYETSIRRLSNFMGTELPEIIIKGKGPKKPELNKRLLTEFNRLNKLDIEFYEEARRIHNGRFL